MGVLTMTTRPAKFGKMLSILSSVAERCDEPEDEAAGKARFRVPAWTVWAMLRRRTLASLGVGVAAMMFGLAIWATGR